MCRSNRPMLLATLAQMGLGGTDLGIAPDKPDALARLLDTGLQHDVLVTSGGVSMGSHAVLPVFW